MHSVKLLSVFLCVLSVCGLVAAQACPSNGIVCWPGDCCAQYRQCIGDYWLPVMPTAPGTVCKAGFLVHARDCTTPCPSAPEATHAPSTQAPSTQAPATQAPATQAPATQAPSTPSTQAPATQAPATQAPATQAPATQAPSTPSTQAPATQAPATQAPATQAPSTQRPATQAPATQAPATQAPATQAPATQAPATQAPATPPPVAPTQRPVATQPPATQAPATQAPTKAPTAAPATQAPVATQAPATGGSCSLADIFTQADFNQLFPHANGAAINGLPNQHAIFTYQNLLNAAKRFPDFACKGDVATRKRELAAFLAQTSQESSGWWAGQPYNWGYYFSTEVGCGNDNCQMYCQPSAEYPCFPGKGYFGRGPMQLSWNYNYGQVSKFLYGDASILLRNPDMMFDESGTAFATALWFWMTPQFPKPSCHAVMAGEWAPSTYDKTVGRAAGFGMTTNIINGGLECNTGVTPAKVWNRIGYFRTYAAHFGVSAGDNQECNSMLRF